MERDKLYILLMANFRQRKYDCFLTPLHLFRPRSFPKLIHQNTMREPILYERYECPIAQHR